MLENLIKAKILVYVAFPCHWKNSNFIYMSSLAISYFTKTLIPYLLFANLIYK